MHRHPSCDIDVQQVVRVWMEDFEDGEDRCRPRSDECLQALPCANGCEMTTFNRGGLSVDAAVADNVRAR